jgi:hypothetical protein
VATQLAVSQEGLNSVMIVMMIMMAMVIVMVTSLPKCYSFVSR